MDLNIVGKWAFVVGLVLVLLTGFIAVPMAALALFVLGLVVGFLNITAKETEKFLIAAIALIVLGVAGIQSLSILGTTISVALSTILASLIAFAGASALVVAVKAVIEMSK
ncbi:hypothetical protein ACFL0E_00095 [Nanoarchaeota archaeon]